MRTLLGAGILVALMLIASACDQDAASALKGQTNTTITFYGKAVDQDGAPVAGAQFEFRVEAYPKDWTFETRERPNDVSLAHATSGEDGSFQFTVTGCTLRRTKATRDGYRHFTDEDYSDNSFSNYFYRLIAWSDLWFQSDPERPAVYVFVKDGVHGVSALPCKGGYDSSNGKHWRLNRPGWPLKPSLKDVVQKASKGDIPGQAKGTFLGKQRGHSWASKGDIPE